MRLRHCVPSLRAAAFLCRAAEPALSEAEGLRMTKGENKMRQSIVLLCRIAAIATQVWPAFQM